MGKKLGTLTSVSTTDAEDIRSNISHTLIIKVTAVVTSVDYNILGSLDGTNYFDLESSNIQKTATGVFYLTYPNMPLTHIKGSFEATGGSATLEFWYEGNAQ